MLFIDNDYQRLLRKVNKWLSMYVNFYFNNCFVCKLRLHVRVTTLKGIITVFIQYLLIHSITTV